MSTRRILRLILLAIIVVAVIIATYIQNHDNLQNFFIAIIVLPILGIMTEIVLSRNSAVLEFFNEFKKNPDNATTLKFLLNKVNTDWIEHFLNPTTDFSPLIVNYSFHRVDKPELRAFSSPLEQDQALFADVEKCHYRLIISGEPSSGKTIAMLKVVKEAIELSKKPNPPLKSIPVVFDLPTWDVTKETFPNWLVRQLSVKYQYPGEKARKALKNNEIFFFLDGLDKIGTADLLPLPSPPPQESSAIGMGALRVQTAVDEFNKYRLAHKDLHYVLCCRSDVLASLARQPEAEGTIELHSLTKDQVLDQVGKTGKNTALLGLMQQEPDILQEGTNPFSLKVMLKTFQDGPYDEKLIREVLDDGNLLDKYIELLLFNKRNLDLIANDAPESKSEPDTVSEKNMELSTRYSDNEQIIFWLSELANIMGTGTEFLVEELQPFQLFTGFQRLLYQTLYFTMFVLFIWVIAGVPFGVSAGVEWGAHLGVEKGIQMGVTAFLGAILILGIGIPIAFSLGGMNLSSQKTVRSKPVGEPLFQRLASTVQENFAAAFKGGGWKFSILVGVMIGALRAYNLSISYISSTASVITTFFATTLAVTFTLLWVTGAGLFQDNLNWVTLADAREWNLGRALNGLFAGLALGAVLFVISLFQLIAQTSTYDLDLIVARGVSFTFTLIVCLTILFGLTGTSTKMSLVTPPNQGIRQLFKNGVLSYFLLASVGAIALGIGYGALLSPLDGLVNGILGLTFGILCVAFGFLGVLKHVSLRGLLRWQKRVPPNLIDFLNYMTETTITRQVGGRYLFDTPKLQDYFLKKYNTFFQNKAKGSTVTESTL